MRSLFTIVALLAVAGANPGCSCNHKSGANQDLAIGGDLAAPMVNPSTDGGCTTPGQACATNADCCSGNCDPAMHVCGVGKCGGNGTTCKSAVDCCNLNCAGGTCGAVACISDNQPCSAGGAACCSTQCVGGMCQPLNGTCKTAGNGCAADAECCSNKCDPMTMTCAAPSQVSYCTQVNDICFHDNECCTGVCTIATGSTAGTCASISTSCAVDGLVCSGCTGCCSSYCAPFGSIGSKICQPASGCHVLGDLCLATTDCCGGDATAGLPGSGLVVCVPDPNHPQIGTCSMANVNNCPQPPPPTCHNTCQPEGDVCHFKNNGGCPSNQFPNNCCAAPGNSGVCKLDKLGVPRCYGIGACVPTTGTCASAADCCNNAPCVPDNTGHLHCGAMCSNPSGVCTTTADCCAGGVCVLPPGSLNGTCVAPVPPPADMAGQPPSTDMATQVCAFSGQLCSPSVPCCANNGSCSAPNGGVCPVGATDCTCFLLP